ncbi:actin cortical patch SUR7/pH-response regulator pali [Trametes polyzona]|nr:actin cortical patch SUR7/pH-response regulator pali [Trametes polyzona]
MCSPVFLMFMATTAALVLLVLVTISTPLVQAFYFLSTDIAGGIKFGVFGFCNELTGTCTDKELGYHFEPQLVNPLTTVLVLYPIAAGLTLLGALTLIPVACSRRDRGFPFVLFALLSTLAFLACAGAFGVTMYLFTVARNRFHAQGFSASYGPSIWIALSATVLTLVIALNAGCGTCMSGRLGRQARHLAYTY